ncbi:MAG: tRNA (5-methylaminomethyl-2-thiouridine)(34)-methyltransferase MnmD [Mediterranea sp.]|jgi:tRNA U34 5-methylaminomethyl-2-thiouridine-forming methyltransferase MnmC|nr:tRNA (5-methylaminomethyl-2-thiouridine)(34)-methyltransferase MnmD [Mediterranea sp.]
MERTIEKTADGSATLYVPELEEHYHSIKGAWTESQHVFVDKGLKASGAKRPSILEVGFGTGLNAWLTLLEAEQSGRAVHYTTLELYPLELSLIQGMGYTSDERFTQLHEAPWEQEVTITPHFTLLKHQADANAFVRSHLLRPQAGFDVVYFDAFAPEKQPELWSQELFNNLSCLLKSGGILTTYCAKGVVRRMLQAAGLTTERLPGPPGGKREILRARKLLEVNNDRNLIRTEE